LEVEGSKANLVVVLVRHGEAGDEFSMKTSERRVL
jgi:hypothetical protein